jgi:transcriptional regulator with XRE-family HTH domain
MMRFLGNRVREARNRQGLSQYELAKRTGLSQTTIWRIESRVQDRIDIGIIRRLARELNVSLDWLAGTFDDDVDIHSSPTQHEVPA